MYIQGEISTQYKVNSSFFKGEYLVDNNGKIVHGEVAGIYYDTGKALDKICFINKILYDQNGQRYYGMYNGKLYHYGELKQGYCCELSTCQDFDLSKLKNKWPKVAMMIERKYVPDGIAYINKKEYKFYLNKSS
jgi:hypothetical protein